MRQLLCSAGNIFLKPFRLVLIKKRELDRWRWKKEAIANLYKARLEKQPESRFPAEGIVFSRDRALQLHALLASYLEQVAAAAPLHILYQASTPEHQRAYEEVKDLFRDTAVSFHPQQSGSSFREDLLTILDALRAPRMFFLVDDLVFIEPLDLRDLLRFDPDVFVPSLRLGENLTWCYTQQREQALPGETAGLIEEKDKFAWRWEEGSCDWGYPLSVDGHLFATGEIRAIAHQIQFHAPNTFEDNLQHFQELFAGRYGLCYRKSRVVNIPCNRVQQENRNIHGEIHQDFLLARWQAGMQMDFRKLYGFENRSAHQEIVVTLISR